VTIDATPLAAVVVAVTVWGLNWVGRDSRTRRDRSLSHVSYAAVRPGESGGENTRYLRLDGVSAFVRSDVGVSDAIVEQPRPQSVEPTAVERRADPGGEVEF